MSLSPQQIDELHRRAEQALLAGRGREAHELCLRILEADRRHADAWFICAVIAGQNKQFEKALQILANACELEPERAEYHAERGKCLVALNRNREALDAAIVAKGLDPDTAPVLNTLGTVFSHCGEHDRAIECYESATARLDQSGEDAQHADLHFNRAVSLQFAGRVKEAAAAYERAITLHPEYFKAHSALATLERSTPDNNHLQRLEELRDRAVSPVDRLHLGHAIARELEDLEDYSGAMENLAWAKRAHAGQSGYDIGEEAKVFDRLEAVFTADRLASPEGGCASDEPIFIVGMPRTGTTLVEQILGSHSQVFAAGEMPQFPQQVARMCGAAPEAGTDLGIADIDACARCDPAELGQAYIESTRPRTGRTPRFTDKLPRNFLYLGLIRMALPRAKLVCLRRDPVDTCLSNYRQLFAVNAPHYRYNLDLLDCGRYYILFDRLMRHWQTAMPGALYQLGYEHLVNDPEGEVARLLAFCELPFEQSCLAFHQRDNTVATPSSLQVKQGIYDSAIGRWKKYGDSVLPLYDLLLEAGCYEESPGSIPSPTR